jgi:hypothetical protein
MSALSCAKRRSDDSHTHLFLVLVSSHVCSFCSMSKTLCAVRYAYVFELWTSQRGLVEAKTRHGISLPSTAEAYNEGCSREEATCAAGPLKYSDCLINQFRAQLVWRSLLRVLACYERSESTMWAKQAGLSGITGTSPDFPQRQVPVPTSLQLKSPALHLEILRPGYLPGL